MIRRRGLALLLASAAVACQSPEVPAPGKPLVVASFYPLYEFSREVAGDRAQVVALVPAGVAPHDWEPSPQDAATIRRARVFVYNGAGFEPWVDRLLPELLPGATVVVRATDGIELGAAVGPGHDDRHGHAKAGTLDPHVWLDPVLAQRQVETIRAGLTAADPANATAFADNAQAFTARLTALDAAFAQGLAACARRDLVASHAAFGYLARRYRLEVIPVMGIAPEAEPSPARLASIARLAKRRNVKYIFFETLVSPRLAETLAREVGARTLVFNPIEGLTPAEAVAGKGYLALMEENLANLRTALECR